MNSPAPHLITYGTPNIRACTPAAHASRRSYYFRLSVSRRPVNETLSLDLCRALWRVANSKASRIS